MLYKVVLISIQKVEIETAPLQPHPKKQLSETASFLPYIT